MKTIIRLSIVLSIVLNVGIHGACPTNPLDCPGNPFIGPLYRNIELTPTCTLRYEYCYRTATCYSGIEYYDLFIGQLQLIGSCSYYETDIINNIKQYIQYCVTDVVANDDPWEAIDEIPECCPPSSSPCWTEWAWRHGHYACYTDWYWDPVTGYLTIDECDVIDPRSCWDRSRYCFVYESQPSGPPEKKLNHETQSYISETNCPEFGGINGDLECHPACD